MIDITEATERAELVEAVAAEWETAYGAFFAALAARLNVSRAEALAFYTYLLVNEHLADDEPWKG